MAEQFDAYHVWLGIPPKEQPPTHYRLLSIEVFEKNLDAIASAADKQMAHLRTFQTGKHSALSQRLLNEVSAARVCLLNPQKKAAYDRRLRETSRSDDSLDSGLVEALQQAESRKATAPAKRPQSLGILIGVGAVVVVVLGVIVWLAIPRERPAVAIRPEPKPVQQPVTPREEQPTTAPPVTKTEPAPVPPKPFAPEEVSKAVKPPAETAPVRPARPAVEPPGSKAPSPEPKPGTTPSPAPPFVQQPPPKPESAPTQAAPKQKLPVPNDAALEQARKAADALFKAEIEKAKTSVDKVALARRLLAQAVDQAGAADQYVLMLTAQDLAVAARDADTAFQVIDQLAEAFEVDRFAMKTGILAGWAKDARTPDARKRVVELMLVIGEEALDAGNLEAAKELGKLATGKMSGLRDKDLVQKLKAYRQRFTEAGKDAEELREAQATLAKDSKDPQANLVGGRYLCFTKGDWKKGLPLLVLGSDETLKGLADRELSSPPTQPTEQVNLADGWWEIASTRRRSQMSSIKIHAGLWYRQAGAALPPGLVKNNVEKRLAEVAKLRSQLPLPPPAIAPFEEKQAKQHQQRWGACLGEPVEMTNSIGMKLVVIPPGEFEMGSTPEEITAEIERAKKNKEPQNYFLGQVPAEGPRHRVKITKPFYLGMYQVTQGEYEKVMGVNPSAFTEKQVDASSFKPPLLDAEVKNRLDDRKKVVGKDTSRYAVETVNWDEATEFCRRLSAMPAERAARRVYRLPTEAEWEYACQAGTTTRWYCGDDEARLVDVGWLSKNSDGVTHPVGEKKPNAWGLYDMHGNLWQWCADWYDKGYYERSANVDPTGPTGGSYRVNRGGYWGIYAAFCRSAYRHYCAPGRRPDLGLRVCLVLAE